MKKGMIFMALLISCILLAAEVNIVGTWKGETEVPDSLDPDLVTLVIKKVEGKYEGTVTDSMGMAQEAKCYDIILDGAKLTMNFEIVNPDGDYVRIYVNLTVEGDIMKGYWESEDGNTNSLELKRQ